MKRTFLVLLLSVLLVPAAEAQTGAVVYSLPRTTVNVKVEARREAFTAGPYAAYAQKYLGVAARTQNGTTYTLLNITLTPYVEADPASAKSLLSTLFPEDMEPQEYVNYASDNPL